MSSRRLLPALAAILFFGALAVWLILRPTPPPATVATAPARAQPPISPPTAPPAPPPAAVADGSALPVSVALELNSPRFDVTHDLVLLNDLFNDWRVNFPHGGNPWGDNAEITAALTGDNPLRLPLLPHNHPAVSANGELCDRWGTPFRFHALAGDRMELRSAGPDKKFGTADDALLTPPSPIPAPAGL
jgi:hypothetical protein